MAEFLGAEYVLPVTIRDERTRILTTTRSLRRVAFESPGQVWQFDLTLALVSDRFSTETLLARLQAHQAANGVAGTFTVACPQHRGTRFELPANGRAPELAADADAGATSAMVRWQDANTGVVTIPAGRLLRIGSGTKAYMLTQDLVLPDAQTPVEANFRPGLLTEIPADTNLRLGLGSQGLPIEVRWGDNNEFAVTYERRGLESSFIPMTTVYWQEAV